MTETPKAAKYRPKMSFPKSFIASQISVGNRKKPVDHLLCQGFHSLL